MTRIDLATEDELSEEIGARLAEDAGLEVGLRLRIQGNGYLRGKIVNFCGTAQRQPVLLITDLDQKPCASALISDWMGARNIPKGLVFRVAVREVEAWLPADHEAMGKLLAMEPAVLPRDPDEPLDPKATLLSLAQKAPRDGRNDLTPKKGAAAPQGLGYNAVLCPWVRNVWRPGLAANRSRSLARARLRLQELAG